MTKAAAARLRHCLQGCSASGAVPAWRPRALVILLECASCCLLYSGCAVRLTSHRSQTYTNVPPELADPSFFHKLAAGQQQQQQGQHTESRPPPQAAAAVPKATAMQRYALTKLYNLWFVKQLASMLASGSGSDSSSTRLLVNAVSPGFVPTTELSRYAGPLGRLGMKYIMSWAPFAVTVQVGQVFQLSGPSDC